MAKDKYIVQTELDSKNAIRNAKELQKEINNIGRLAKETNKNAKITGSVDMKQKGIKETQRALDLAKKNADNLSRALTQAKMSGATEKQVKSLENQLLKAQTQAQRLDNELAQLGSGGGKKSFMGGAIDKIKSAGSTMLGTFSKVGNIVSGISAGWGLVSGAVSKATGFIGGYAQRLMDTYDIQKQAQKTLSTTLSDGAKGYEQFNSHIDKGNALLKSQKTDLNELGAMISSYMKISGEEAFKTVNAINAIGDSLGLSMDVQKQFTYGLSQALGSGTLHAQDFNQIMQSALGAQFRDMLIQAANEMQNVGMTAEQLPDALKKGKVEADLLANTFGDNWANKMAKAQTALKGIEVSTGGVKRMLKDGQLTVQDFTRVFGEDFTNQLLNAMNTTSEGAVTMENFKQKMEEGVFSTDVMNRAIELFQQKGEQLASEGPSTWAQIREMISNGFNTSSLEGFRTGLSNVDIDMATFGNSATEITSQVGQYFGQMAGQAVGSLAKIIDKNKDGKVSEDEFKGAVNDAKGAIDKFFSKINGSSIVGFIKEISKAVRELNRLYNWLNDIWVQADRVLDKLRNIGGQKGLIGNLFGWQVGGKGSGGGRGWLLDPSLTSGGGLVDKAVNGVTTSGRPNPNLMPLNLQLFGNYAKSVNKALESASYGLNGSAINTSTVTSQDNSVQDIKIYVQSTADGQRIANEIYSKLERNGVKLNKR